MESPLVRIPATRNENDEEIDLCVNPNCGRNVGLAGVFVAGHGRICGSCFRQVRRGIVMDENNELRSVWK